MYSKSNLKMITLNDGSKYKLDCLINQGAWSKVYRYISTTDASQKIAVKCLPKSEVRLAEMDIITRLAPLCPYLLPVLEIIVEKDELKMVMKEGISFEKFFFGISKEKVESPIFGGNPLIRVKFIIELIRAIAFLHSQGVMHLDIKPHNCVIYFEGDIPYLTLGDFGFTQYIYSLYDQHSPRFSIVYEPIERLTQGSKKVGPYKAVDDIYSLGLTCLKFIGTVPELENLADLDQQVKTYQKLLLDPEGFKQTMETILINSSIPLRLHTDLKELIRGCITKPEERWDYKQLLIKSRIISQQIEMDLWTLPIYPRLKPFRSYISYQLNKMVNSIVETYLTKEQKSRHHTLLTLQSFYNLVIKINREEMEVEYLEKLLYNVDIMICRLLEIETTQRPTMDLIDLANLCHFKLYHIPFINTSFSYPELLKVYSNLVLYIKTFYVGSVKYPPKLKDQWIKEK